MSSDALRGLCHYQEFFEIDGATTDRTGIMNHPCKEYHNLLNTGLK